MWSQSNWSVQQSKHSAGLLPASEHSAARADARGAAADNAAAVPIRSGAEHECDAARARRQCELCTKTEFDASWGYVSGTRDQCNAWTNHAWTKYLCEQCQHNARSGYEYGDRSAWNELYAKP
ncbi:hypothetical protein E2C01_020003 [Portunus trituberculatus]|uniref:Uncharacterized protein n=1 Tax=Portunus trituberculatus TaxID=210409 RepID=A0A5B7DYR1_PORTR|nr:hypothetical protein [Portunus trituberculatus]